MDQPKLLKEALSEALEQKGMNREKLAASTGVPDRFIEALTDGETTELPSAPYVRGYLKKIGTALELDADELWRMHERESAPKQSGAADLLPKNRFAIAPTNKLIVGAIVLGVAALLYAALGSGRLIGTPRLSVTNPSDETSTATLASIAIEGTLGNANDTLTINGEAVYVDESGAFKKTFPLEAGLNNFDITAKRFLGKTVTVTRRVVYTPEPATSETSARPLESLPL